MKSDTQSKLRGIEVFRICIDSKEMKTTSWKRRAERKMVAMYIRSVHTSAC